MKMKIYRIPHDFGTSTTYEYEAPAGASKQELLDAIINDYGRGKDTLILYDDRGAKVAAAIWPQGSGGYERHYSGWELDRLPPLLR